MENIDKLAVALVKAQKEMKGAKKDSENPFFKSQYADLGSVWKACHEALTDNGFSVVQNGVHHDGLFFLRTTLIHSSGQSLSGEYLIKPTKDDPQGYGSAWTYARRYSLAAMVGVISEDDDGNAATHDNVPTVKREPAKPEIPAATIAKDIKSRPYPKAEAGPADIAVFIPVDVDFMAGTGKGAGKTFSKIKAPDGKVYDSSEVGGEIAVKAKEAHKQIAVTFAQNGRYLNAKLVKYHEDPKERTEAPESEAVIDEVPF